MDDDETDYKAQRKREMLADAEPIVFALFYAAATAAGKGKPQAEQMLSGWKARYELD